MRTGGTLPARSRYSELMALAETVGDGITLTESTYHFQPLSVQRLNRCWRWELSLHSQIGRP